MMRHKFFQDEKKTFENYVKKDEKLSFKKVVVEENIIYFIYKTKTITLKDKISSYDLSPIGFIHYFDDEYYFYSFDGNCHGYEKIVKKFVEECLI